MSTRRLEIGDTVIMPARARRNREAVRATVVSQDIAETTGEHIYCLEWRDVRHGLRSHGYVRHVWYNPARGWEV